MGMAGGARRAEGEADIRPRQRYHGDTESATLDEEEEEEVGREGGIEPREKQQIPI